jgi:hypothetical protein
MTSLIKPTRHSDIFPLALIEKIDETFKEENWAMATEHLLFKVNESSIYDNMQLAYCVLTSFFDQNIILNYNWGLPG